MQRALIAAFFATTLTFQARTDAVGAENTTDSVPGGTLVVRVKKVGSQQGRVCVWLFAQEKGFPSKKEKAAHRGCAPVKGGEASVGFRDIPFGTYAAFAFHDADKNGRVLTNWIGMPKEGVGASRGAGGIGGPSFEDARFAHNKDKGAISISLKYL